MPAKEGTLKSERQGEREGERAIVCVCVRESQFATFQCIVFFGVLVLG